MFTQHITCLLHLPSQYSPFSRITVHISGYIDNIEMFKTDHSERIKILQIQRLIRKVLRYLENIIRIQLCLEVCERQRWGKWQSTHREDEASLKYFSRLFLDLFLIPLFGFRNNGLSLAETASKSLNSLFSLKERVSPRLLGLKVRIKVFVKTLSNIWLLPGMGEQIEGRLEIIQSKEG